MASYVRVPHTSDVARQSMDLSFLTCLFNGFLDFLSQQRSFPSRSLHQLQRRSVCVAAAHLVVEAKFGQS